MQIIDLVHVPIKTVAYDIRVAISTPTRMLLQCQSLCIKFITVICLCRDSDYTLGLMKPMPATLLCL